ncbi:Spindle defective protein 3 [Caenorhabditis elegans]|uniref:Spindle defective protein 3 n=1 Tax=Caenorhabditis elegans TaxID=6239 RepID=SPD3_CAEEL|nr:Spindle defective protein 3 [Caenorhabditis elegans]Q9TYY7.1 RecName: Full=Spindle defective protein 3 [Caenorhabditis elegans]CCD65006.1 Spindle defective protein 3 [Caenorhabditis elegans]|eukprot:NP_501036.1 Uncharacterized protein CELE_H34C03.1 [Caenorhabditis elegans]
MDQMTVEEKILEHQELEDGSSSFRWLVSSTVIAIGGATVALYISGKIDWKIPAIEAGLALTAGGTITCGYLWFKKRVKTVRKLILQMNKTRSALRKRRQIFFSISMCMPRHRHPSILRACRLTVSAIECLTEETKSLNNGTTWQDLYTDEIREIISRSTVDSQLLKIEEIQEGDNDKMDFEQVFETLISIFKLHASEYSRVVILNFLNSPVFESKKVSKFFETLGRLQELMYNLESVERLALKTETKLSRNERKMDGKMKNKSLLELGWKQQTALALEAILERLESESVTQSEVESALHKTFLVVKAEPAFPQPVKKIDVEVKNQDQKNPEVIVIEKGTGERTDIDMVFEGTPLSEADKLSASKSAVARDVLLDGSEGRCHEASLFGELKMVLEPRRTDFAKRERTALAKFYGVDEHQLEQKEDEETFEAIASGDGEDPDPYDWRKDAEMSAGIHHDANNDDFLKSLKLRRVDDDIIE